VNRLELPKSLPVAYNADIAPPEKHSGGILGSFFKENDEAKRNELCKNVFPFSNAFAFKAKCALFISQTP
jgi:hypothetical protein